MGLPVNLRVSKHQKKETRSRRKTDETAKQTTRRWPTKREQRMMSADGGRWILSLRQRKLVRLAELCWYWYGRAVHGCWQPTDHVISSVPSLLKHYRFPFVLMSPTRPLSTCNLDLCLTTTCCCVLRLTWTYQFIQCGPAGAVNIIRGRQILSKDLHIASNSKTKKPKKDRLKNTYNRFDNYYHERLYPRTGNILKKISRMK